MAAVSAPQAATALTPPSSSHGGQSSWNFSVPAQQENPQSKTNDYKAPLSQTNGALKHSNSRPELSNRRADTFNSTRSAESTFLAPARVNALARKDSSISDSGSAPDSLLDLYGQSRSNINSVDYGERKQSAGEMYGDAEDPDHSRWIHRDKLARIESQELQAAGIILPRARATSKSSRRDHSRDQQGTGVRSEQAQKRQRIESFPTEEEEEAEDIQSWDLRLPEEVADDPGDMYKELNGKQGVSRIPVCKTSPVPIPLDYLERDTPMKRKQSGGWTGEDEAIQYPKSRGRSQSIKVLEDSTATPTPAKRIIPEGSPTKKTPVRKESTGAAATRTTSANQRPKTRSGPNRDPSGPRPTTRSGEFSGAKRPEGDPPWLASMYKPDPRLPPDQQLLPTVAKRLQQEQWEKEGKFGTVYDSSFRPLNDEQLPQPPQQSPQTLETPEKSENRDPEWPLRRAKSPAPSTGRPGTAGTQTYSTMPKIQGTPQGVGPLPSPKPPIRLQPEPENSKKGGCGCCVVM